MRLGPLLQSADKGGGNPVAVPGHSPQCTSGQYAPNEIIVLLATPADNARVQSCDPSSFVAGQTVTLLAAPANGWHVASWSGTTNNQSTAVSNSVVIGSEATKVGVIYAKDASPKSALFLPTITN